jgi:hypothetical protein
MTDAPVPIFARTAPAKPVLSYAAVKPRDKERWGWLELFVIMQVLAPAILFLPGTQALRVPIRILPFAMSLAGLLAVFMARRDPRPHPAWALMVGIIAYLTLMVLHPYTNTFITGAAQTALYAAAMAPVFWAPYFVKGDRQIVRVLGIILVCNGINAAVGVMQVIDPATWMPVEFSTVATEQYGPMSYLNDSGTEVVRPPGLSDAPGAVCGPATTAALLGFIAITLRIPWWAKVLSLGASAAGVAAILLSHVRTNFLVLLGMLVVYLLLLFFQREYRRATTLTLAAAVIAITSFLGAVSLGGTAVVDRFATLVEEDPFTVYYYRSARGYMTHRDTAHYLEQHPLGAGLGRWGMMRMYFGDPDNPRSTPLWAEVQLAAWALDGGYVLLIGYMLAILIESIYELRVALYGKDPALRRIGAIVFASNLGIAALVLSYTPFSSQVGVMYWLMAGILHGAVLLRRQQTAGQAA